MTHRLLRALAALLLLAAVAVADDGWCSYAPFPAEVLRAEERFCAAREQIDSGSGGREPPTAVACLLLLCCRVAILLAPLLGRGGF
jgi:hypothetical protein